ncbi:MAG: type II secretion system F family protein [Pseudomonadota bacterium]
MPEFTYHAVDADGHATRGVMAAESEKALERRLREVGYWLIDASTARQHRQKSGNVTRGDLIEFLYGMSSLLAAGVTAADALNAMVEETTNESFRIVLEDIELNVNAGSSIYDAISAYPGIFNDQARHLIQAGEYSGNLATAFKDLAEHIEWTQKLIGDVKQATLYPAMIVTAVIGLIVLMITFVVPRFAAIFEDLDMELPVLTRGVIILGDWAQSFGWILLLALIAGAVAAVVSYRRSEEMQLLFDGLSLKIPVFGEIVRMLVLSRFTHNLSLMVAAGVPILQALELCRGLVGNRVMEQAVASAEEAVNEGRRVSEALREHAIVSPLVLRMLTVGEETGRLDQALEHVAKRFDTEVPRRIQAAFAILEPAIMMTLIGVVGLIGGAVFLPMFSLMSGLS